jgi:predicted phage-related endonuclease
MNNITHELIEHDLIQGSAEWVEFRANHDGASEAAAMLGISKKTSRTELLRMKSSGLSKEFSAWVQENILDHGHEVEEMARPIMEQQIGSALYPSVFSRGRTSASCDGITMSGNTGWEHKQWNEKLAADVATKELPDEFMAQPQQCLMVTHAEKWIFTVSDGTNDKKVSMEILPDPAWFERLTAGWAQFNKERENYIHEEVIELPKAEVTIELPALFVHARGEITTHNLDEFGLALTGKLAEVRAIVLLNDQDFSNAKAAAVMFRAKAKEIKLSKDAMLAQTETIGEAARKMDAWAIDLNATALQLEKDVAKEDLKKKEAMINEASVAFTAHIETLEAETKPIRLNAQKPDFAGAIKGKSKYASMQDAINTALSNGIIAADAIAKDYRAKLAWCKENAAGMSMLFPDLQQIIAKPMDDFTLLITSRIDKHKADEAERLEAERVKMQAEATAKAEREAAAKLAAEEARIRAEERAKAEAEQQAIDATAQREHEKSLAGEPAVIQPVKDIFAPENKQSASMVGLGTTRVYKPDNREIVRAIEKNFGVSYGTACDWLLEVAESLKVAA